MLMLWRRYGESIVIGRSGDITVTLMDIKDDHALLGFVAPKDIIIHRQEIYRKIQSASTAMPQSIETQTRAIVKTPSGTLRLRSKI